MRLSIKFRPIAYIKAKKHVRENNEAQTVIVHDVTEEIGKMKAKIDIATNIVRKAGKRAKNENVNPASRERAQQQLKIQADLLTSYQDELDGFDQRLTNASAAMLPKPKVNEYFRLFTKTQKVETVKAAEVKKRNVFKRAASWIKIKVLNPIGRFFKKNHAYIIGLIEMGLLIWFFTAKFGVVKGLIVFAGAYAAVIIGLLLLAAVIAILMRTSKNFRESKTQWDKVVQDVADEAAAATNFTPEGAVA